MNTLKTFSEKERAYHRYQARQNYLRQQKSIENHLNALRAEIDQARLEKEQARAAEERERVEKEAALAEIVPTAVAVELAEGRQRGIDVPDPGNLPWIRLREPLSQAVLPLMIDLRPGQTAVANSSGTTAR